MGSPRSKRIDVARNHRLLLDAATSALAANPEASLGDVAQRAGLTRATLYRHFSSRENLLDALREDALMAAEDALASVNSDECTTLEALRQIVSAILSLGPRFRPLLLDGADQDPDFVSRREKVFAPVADVVERGQRSGEIRSDLSPQWIAAALTALLAAGVRFANSGHSDLVTEIVFNTLVTGVQKTIA